MRMRFAHGGILSLLSCALLSGSGAVAGAMTVRSVGATAEFHRLEMGTDSGDPGDSLQLEGLALRAWTRVEISERWNARLELATGRTRLEGDREGEMQVLSGAVLVRYELPERGWMLQAGIGLPAGSDNLTSDENLLVRYLSDPLTASAEPEPVRPLRLHVGASGGRILTRWLTALAGVGYEHSAAYRPLGDLEYRAGSRFMARLGLNGQAGKRVGELRVALVWAGRDKLEGERYRDGRHYASAQLTGGDEWVGLRIGLTGTLATSSAVDWLITGGGGRPVSGGPGLLGALGAEIAPARAWGDHLRPRLVGQYRRHQPDGLPYGDGWLLTLAGGLEITTGGMVIDISGGWQSGTWHRWANPGYERASDCTGPRVGVAFGWERSEE